MTGFMHPQPGPGLVCRPVPPAPVTVRDPDGKHRIFKQARDGTLFGANMVAATIWSACVTVGGIHYVVPPHWVHDPAGGAPALAPASAVILPFPAGGRRY